MNAKVSIFIAVICLTFQSAYGQAESATKFRRVQNNSIYIEFLGNGAPSFYSLNYERVLFSKNGYYMAGRIGAGYTRFLGERFASTPVILINQYYQFSNCFLFEASLGYGYKWRYFDDDYDDPYDREPNLESSHFLTGTIGFRYQHKKGFLLRIGFTPHYNFSDYFAYNKLQAFAGISLGYGF